VTTSDPGAIAPLVPASFNLADFWEAAADRCGERIALVFGDRRLTYAELEDRSNRLANWMRGQGVRPGDHVGVYLENCPEYVEAMLAAYKLRAVPINVNYRYREAELRHLFVDADLVGVVCKPEFVERVDAIWDECPELAWSLQTNEYYDTVLASASPGRPLDASERTGDDTYVIYTGGTTGAPKGVVWRQEDAFFACIGGGDPMRMAGPAPSPADVPDRIIDGSFVYLPVAPLMHAAGQWTVLSWLFAGGTVVLLAGSLDPPLVWRTIGEEGVNLMTVVGDAVVRPLVDEWDRSGPYDVSSLFSIGSGGAPLTPALKARFVEALPNTMIVDGFGSSETGAQGAQRLTPGDAAAAGAGPAKFVPYGETTTVLDEESRLPVEPGSGQVGRVALRGRIPQGYYNDPEKTAATFVEWDGHRWVLTGDLATVDADGNINLLGRGSQVINTGGEKVFVEEVEAALKAHPGVYDAVVVGVADERWGERVAAVVHAAAGATVDADALIAATREQLAGYKVPKSVTFVDHIERSPAGKADYRWAAQVASGSDA
jgi:acyl-CoA synthetase (AMP-forming)/AMP-acid ligase II